MPPASSLAALSRLSSLQGAGNQYFDPTGADADRNAAVAQASDLTEAQTGQNPTARFELAQAQQADQLDQLDANRATRADTTRRQNAAWMGPDGMARTSPAIASGDNEQYLGDERVAHAGINLPEVLRQARETALAGGRAQSDVYWQPGQQSMRADTQRQTEDLNRSRYTDPAQIRADAELQNARITAGGRTDVANITGAASSRNADVTARARAVAAMLNRADFNPGDPDQVSQIGGGIKSLQDVLGTGAPPPAPSGDTPGAHPDGTEGSVNGAPAVWRNAGSHGPGWYRK